MTRTDLIVLKRLGSRIVLTVLLLFGMVALVESMNTWRFEHLSSIGGPLLGISAILLNAGFWSLGTLPVTLLVGAIVGLLDLQARRELVVINASGISVWQVMRAPLAAVLLAGLVISFGVDAALVTMMRSLSVNLPQASSGGELWLEQQGNEGQAYTMVALHPHPGGTILEDVTFFLPEELGGPRLRAERAELRNGSWEVTGATRYAPDSVPERVGELSIPTTTTPGDLGARLSAPGEMTIYELIQLQGRRVSDASLLNGVQMRLARLTALPLMLGASLIIAFAFTAGYRRTNKYGVTVLYGIVLGFVVYVVTEMAATAGSSGVLQPAFAAFAPALVALVVGTTVLLFREDGRR